LRGLGLGFLFLSITLIAFSNLNSRNLAFGIGLFNTGRQLGGLMGVAGLQTLIDHNVVGNVAVLGANLTAGVPAVSERLTTTTAMLVARGMDAAAASRAAMSLLGRVVTGQSTVIAFDTAFNAVALLFVIAAPVLVAIKIGLHRYTKLHAAQSPRTVVLRPPLQLKRERDGSPLQQVPLNSEARSSRAERPRRQRSTHRGKLSLESCAPSTQAQ
jgi:MFS transporter, DHA2 family, multidrug resistance protein